MCDFDHDIIVAIVAIVSIFVVLPALILNFLKNRPRPAPVMTTNDGIDSAELVALAERLEARVRALESLLAASDPRSQRRPVVSLDKALDSNS